MLHSVGGASELADLSPPTLRGQGNSQACGICVFSLEEEKKRNSVIRPPSHGTGGREHLQCYWHLGTSGALWVAGVMLRPPALLQTSLL